MRSSRGRAAKDSDAVTSWTSAGSRCAASNAPAAISGKNDAASMDDSVNSWPKLNLNVYWDGGGEIGG